VHHVDVLTEERFALLELLIAAIAVHELGPSGGVVGAARGAQPRYASGRIRIGAR
jgi:hypothetical protein